MVTTELNKKVESKSQNIFVGNIFIILGILGITFRIILTGVNKFWDIIMIGVFLFVIIMGGSFLRKK